LFPSLRQKSFFPPPFVRRESSFLFGSFSFSDLSWKNLYVSPSISFCLRTFPFLLPPPSQQSESALFPSVPFPPPLRSKRGIDLSLHATPPLRFLRFSSSREDPPSPLLTRGPLLFFEETVFFREFLLKYPFPLYKILREMSYVEAPPFSPPRRNAESSYSSLFSVKDFLFQDGDLDS